MIGFIGAGKCGMSLAGYFKRNNIEISGFCSNHTEECEFEFMDADKLIKKSDIIFITTSDTAIGRVWNDIKGKTENKIICHCSGSLSSAIFYGADSDLTASVHPMLAFNSKYTEYDTISSAFFTLEGGNTAIYKISEILNICGNNYRKIDKKDKPLYHAAACFASNFVVAVCEKAELQLMQCGFSRDEAHKALTPLMLNNMDNIIKSGTHNAITGPAARGDILTIQKHLGVVGDDKDLYNRLTQIIFDMKKY